MFPKHQCDGHKVSSWKRGKSTEIWGCPGKREILAGDTPTLGTEGCAGSGPLFSQRPPSCVPRSGPCGPHPPGLPYLSFTHQWGSAIGRHHQPLEAGEEAVRSPPSPAVVTVSPDSGCVSMPTAPLHGSLLTPSLPPAASPGLG